MDNLFTILVLLLAGWFWLDSLRARELATGICRAACEQRGLQFLDQTVALRRLGVRRTPAGLRLRRVYRFDFSEEGGALGTVLGHVPGDHCDPTSVRGNVILRKRCDCNGCCQNLTVMFDLHFFMQDLYDFCVDVHTSDLQAMGGKGARCGQADIAHTEHTDMIELHV